MRNLKLNNYIIDDLIKSALKEDINYIDISTSAIYEDDKTAIVDLIAKEDGIISGLDVFSRVFEILDKDVVSSFNKEDGNEVKKGEVIGYIKGNVRTLLTGERVALNFLGMMSGISTQTNKLVRKLNDKDIKIVDTRKTTPNLRALQKYAVLMGGGYNHRYNLSDMVMLKDNHIKAAGSILNAVNMVKGFDPFFKKIEVEVETLDMVREAISSKADIIMLDNMDLDTIKEAINIIDGKAIIEISGNVSEDTIDKYRGLKIDYISSGYITHSYRILDLSMKNLRYEDEGEKR